MYEIVQMAGYVGETVAGEAPTWSQAVKLMDELYTPDEQDDLHVAIRLEGSYEFT